MSQDCAFTQNAYEAVNKEHSETSSQQPAGRDGISECQGWKGSQGTRQHNSPISRYFLVLTGQA